MVMPWAEDTSITKYLQRMQASLDVVKLNEWVGTCISCINLLANNSMPCSSSNVMKIKKEGDVKVESHVKEEDIGHVNGSAANGDEEVKEEKLEPPDIQSNGEVQSKGWKPVNALPPDIIDEPSIKEGPNPNMKTEPLDQPIPPPVIEESTTESSASSLFKKRRPPPSSRKK